MDVASSRSRHVVSDTRALWNRLRSPLGRTRTAAAISRGPMDNMSSSRSSGSESNWVAGVAVRRARRCAPRAQRDATAFVDRVELELGTLAGGPLRASGEGPAARRELSNVRRGRRRRRGPSRKPGDTVDDEVAETADRGPTISGSPAAAASTAAIPNISNTLGRTNRSLVRKRVAKGGIVRRQPSMHLDTRPLRARGLRDDPQLGRPRGKRVERPQEDVATLAFEVETDEQDLHRSVARMICRLPGRHVDAGRDHLDPGGVDAVVVDQRGPRPVLPRGESGRVLQDVPVVRYLAHPTGPASGRCSGWWRAPTESIRRGVSSMHGA